MAITSKIIAEKNAELLSTDGFFAREEVVVNGRTVKQYTHADNNLVELLQKGRVHAEKICMVYEENRWTYDEFYSKADALNDYLQQVLNVFPGDKVAIAMRNYPEWGACFFGAAFAGAVVVPLNSWGKKEELLFGVQDSECRVLICDEQRYNLIKEDARSLGIDILIARATDASLVSSDTSFARSLDSVLENAGDKPSELASVDSDDTAMMLYTSGSTGSPKGVPLTHRAACQAMMNYFYSGALTMMLDGADESAPEQLVNLQCVPFFHGTGLFAGLLVAVAMGFKTVMMYKWDPVLALQLIEKEGVTQTNAVPTLVQSLLVCEEFDNYDTSSLKRLGTGGASAPTTLPQLVKSKLKDPVCGTGWGMTETCVLGVAMGGSAYDLKPNAAGIKSPIIELRITGKSGEVLPNGESGEIECKGVTVFHGYWKNDEATAKTFSGEWLQTGDVGYLDDDDYLFITGRSKDLVIRGGENIFPGEIEDACYAIEGVMEAAVYGVPDDAMGEELSLEVFLSASARADAGSIRGHLADHLAGFKVPRYIKVRDDALPKNVANKIDKITLKRQWLEPIESV